MNPRFVAIPVSDGDSFYFKDESIRVLVDGGIKDPSFASLLTTHTGTDRIDVIICTHNDSDHAGGLISLLKARLKEEPEDRIKLHEIWLPAEFRLAIQASRELGIEETVRILSQIENSDFGADDDPAPGGSAVPERRTAAEARSELNEDRDRVNLFVSSDDGRLIRTHCDALAKRLSPRSSHRENQLPGRKGAFGTSDAIKAMRNVAELASLSVKNRLKIRWLEYTERDSEAYHCISVTVLNGSVIHVPREPETKGLPDLLRLSIQNRRALVVRAEIDGKSDVLLTSDSGLGFVSTRLAGLGLVTAPHHGSADPENLKAYSHVTLLNTTLLVRSDGRQPRGRINRPCTLYTTHPLRRCTRCRGSRVRQRVEAEFVAGSWRLVGTCTACRC